MRDFQIDVEKKLNKLGRDLQQFVERVVPVVDEGQDFAPACDIVESGDRFDIFVDLPGISKDDIDLQRTDRVLTVQGQRDTEMEEDPQYVRRERKRGKFSRSFALPDDVDVENIEATFDNGVLSVHVPKLKTARNAQTINID